MVDCLIIGGGPAGLTAAIYAGRFGLDVVLVDAGDSRARQISCSHNQVGFPDGISGDDLLARMRIQASSAGATLQGGVVTAVTRNEDFFTATLAEGELDARAVLLATGVTNRRPPLTDASHRSALAAGQLRYCPVCDGAEVVDQRVAVLGTGDRGFKEALFLRAHTRQVTLVAPHKHELSPEQRDTLDAIGVLVLEGPAHEFELEGELISFRCAAGRQAYQVLYPALGSIVHSELAVSLGAKTSSDGCIEVDSHQRASVRGLYAAGDVVLGLDQISHAVGEAGVAATTIRNDLAELSPLLR